MGPVLCDKAVTFLLEWSTKPIWCWTPLHPDDHPLRTLRIMADGNCSFVAFSAVITASQDDHAILRTMTVSYILNNLDTMRCVCPNIVEHVNTSNMATLETWGTEVEIIALATILNATVFVFSQCGQTQKWLPYNPLLSGDDTHSVEVIMIQNLSLRTSRTINAYNLCMKWE